jgi:hypothetical protein
MKINNRSILSKIRLLFADDVAAGSHEQLILYRNLRGLEDEETCGNDEESNV